MNSSAKLSLLLLAAATFLPPSLAAKSVDQMLDEGRAALFSGDLKGAQLTFEEILRKKSGNEKARVLLGVVHFEMGQKAAQAHATPAAIAEFRAALKLDPSEAYWHAALARALNAMGEDDAAVQECLAAAQLSPDDSLLTSGCGLKSHLQGGPTQPAPKQEEPQPELVKGVKSASGVIAPVAIDEPQPPYSEKARRVKYQGTTVLVLVISAAGTVTSARVTRPLGLGLDQNALAAVRSWTFKPATRDGTPVPVRVMVEVNFRLY